MDFSSNLCITLLSPPLSGSVASHCHVLFSPSLTDSLSRDSRLNREGKETVDNGVLLGVHTMFPAVFHCVNVVLVFVLFPLIRNWCMKWVPVNRLVEVKKICRGGGGGGGVT